MIFEIAWSYPHASHMNNPAVIQPSMERLSSLVGLLNWQGVDHPWLQEAVDLCLEYVAKTRFTDAHTILNTYCLLESLSQERLVEELFIKLSHDLFQADFFCIDTPVTTYGLTPLSFAPSPNSYCHRIFTDKQIANHLTDLEGQQEKDGGWPIQWDPPKGIARQEWRAYKTVMALFTLHAYGRI